MKMESLTEAHTSESVQGTERIQNSRAMFDLGTR